MNSRKEIYTSIRFMALNPDEVSPDRERVLPLGLCAFVESLSLLFVRRVELNATPLLPTCYVKHKHLQFLSTHRCIPYRKIVHTRKGGYTAFMGVKFQPWSSIG